MDNTLMNNLDPQITLDEAIEFFGGKHGSQMRMAEAFGVSRQLISLWKATETYLPPLYAHRFLALKNQTQSLTTPAGATL